VLNRGRVVHDVLAAFHRRTNERLCRPASPLELDVAEFDSLLAAAIAESLPPEPKNPVQAALREIDRRLVVQWLSQYRGQLEKYAELWQGFDTPLAPELLEISFGRGDEAPPSTAQPLEFVRETQTVRVSGRIDRVDTGVVAGRNVINVLDYKTGGPIKFTAESIRAGTTLQLPIYALAATELLLVARDVLPWQAGYWYVREAGFRPRQALRMYRNDDGRIELETEWEQLRAGLGDTVVMLVRAIRRGQFPVCSTDERCTGHCPYNTICRINQVRSLEKTCQPTASQ
jgi:ATP-dependent helicase/DNAse subunit B